MHRSKLVSTFLSLAGLFSVVIASAAPPEQTSPLPVTAAPLAVEAGEASRSKPREYRTFIGVTGGVVRATVEHPEILKSSFTAFNLGLHAGYRIIPSLSVGLEITAFEKYMRRFDDDARFAPESALEPQADCLSCVKGETGGKTMAVSVSFITVGPRVEYTPFGEDGLYVGAFGGVASVLGVPGSAGFGGAARVGFRLRPISMLSLAVEGGVQAQDFEGGSSIAPHAQLVLRPYF